MSYFLGFDAGGTKTTCALGDDRRILIRAAGGSIKPLRVTQEQAQKNMSALLDDVATRSGVDLRSTAAACIGTAGIRLPQTDGWMRQIVGDRIGGPLLLCGDEEIALDAAFPGLAGVLAMAGTGSNVIGRARDGRMLNVGGWGPALADQGSGHWIGLQALRATFHAMDLGQPALIFERVQAFWNAGTLEDVVNIANQIPPPDFSQLAGIVVACAGEGDAVAIEVLERGGRLLGEDAVAALRRVRVLDPKVGAMGVAFTGSILDKIERVRQSMIETIHEMEPGTMVVPKAVDPLEGALWRARHGVE